MILPQFLEDLRNVEMMVYFVSGVDQDVVNVINHKTMQVHLEHLIHEGLEYGGELASPYGMT